MKYKFSVLIMIAVCLLAGCQKTPYDTERIKSDTENVTQKSTDVIDSDIEPVVITISDEYVEETLECGDVTVILKGNISKPDMYEGLYIYKAEIVNYGEYEQSMMFLFGEYEDLVYKDKISGQLKCCYDEQGKNYMRLVNSSIYDEKNFTGVWGSIFFSKDRKVLSEKKEVGMTNDEAYAKAEEIIKEIGLTSYEYYSTSYYEETLQPHPDGGMSVPFGDSLTVLYVQFLQGVPVLFTGFQRETPHAKIVFDYSGVLYVSVSEYTYEVSKKADKILTYEEALKIFKETISKDSEYDGKVFDSVKFEYTLTKEYINGSFQIVAVPSWHFYYEGIPNAVVTGVDVVINATNGNIIKR